MTLDVETIYRLLPELYRTRDAAVGEPPGGPLEALLTVVAEQAAGLEENIEQLYDDQFIETCAPWVVSYIADLVGYHPLEPRLQSRLGSSRAEVANTIAFRRRKGTAAMLEDLAVSITGWDATVVEFFRTLATTQYLDHLRPDHLGPVDLRRVDDLVAIGSPFDRLAHTADVRNVASGRGRHNIANVGIFLWRVASRRLSGSLAFRVDERRYLFDPLGADTPLYQAAERDQAFDRVAGPLDVPMPITRRALRAQLRTFYGPGRSLVITVDGEVVGVAEVEACDLSDTGPDPETSPWAHDGQTKVAVDPVLGRIAFPEDPGGVVTVSYRYGSAIDVGGGEYERSDATPLSEQAPRVPRDWPTISDALDAVGGDGVIPIVGSGRYAETPVISVAANKALRVGASNGSRPLVLLAGDLVVSGGDSGEVVLDGLLVAGGRVVVPAEVDGQPNRLQKLRLVHCTLVPGGGLTRDGSPGPAPASLEVEAPNVTVEIERCIVGALRVVDGSQVAISHSIVDGLGPANVAYAASDGTGAGGALTVTSCTLVGKVHTAALGASDSIFHASLAAADAWSAPVIVERRQVGYVRYSYVPSNGRVPRRFACSPRSSQDAHRVAPLFTSLRYGRPGYGQLHPGCPWEIRLGASDEVEMGASHDTFVPQREAGLRVRLDEYLRFGLEAGLFTAPQGEP